MTTITIKEFLNNPKDYLDMAESGALILTGKKKKKFYLGVCSEDDEVLAAYHIELEKGIMQARNGQTKTIGDGSMKDLCEYMLK